MPSSASGVRSRILDFEKHNDEVRSSCSLSPATSPKSAGSCSDASLASSTRPVTASRTAAIMKIGAEESAAAASSSSATKPSVEVKAAYNRKATAMARAHLRPHSSVTTTASPAATTRPSGTGSAGTESTVTESSVDTSLPKKKALKATDTSPSPDRPPSSTQKASVIRINRLQARLDEKTASPRPPKKKQQPNQPTSPNASPVKSSAVAVKKPLSPKTPPPKEDPNDPNSPTAINLRNLRQKTTFHQRILGLAEEHVQHQNKQQKLQQQQQQQQVLSQPSSPQSSVDQRNNNHRKGPSSAALLRGAALSKEIDPTSPTRSRSAIRSRPVSRDSDRHQQPAALSPERWQQAVEKLSPEKRQPLLAAVSSSPMARMRNVGGAAAATAATARSSHDEMASRAASSGNGCVPEHHGRRHRQALHQMNQHEEDVTNLFHAVDDAELRLQQPPSVKQHLRSKHANAIMRHRQHRPHQQQQQQMNNDKLFVPQIDEHFISHDFPFPLPNDISPEPDFIPERDAFGYSSAKQQQQPEAATSPRLSLGRNRRSSSRQKQREVQPQPQTQHEEPQPTSPRHILRLQEQFSPPSHDERSRSSLDQPLHPPQHHAIPPQSQQLPPDLQAIASPQFQHEQHVDDSPTKSQPEHESFPHAENHLSFSPAKSTMTAQSYSPSKLPDRRRRRHHPQQQQRSQPPHRRRYHDAIPDEDDMTLTSVRQIIDTQQDSVVSSNANPNSSKSQRSQRSHRSSSSAAAAHHNNRDSRYLADSDDFEEKKSESTCSATNSQEKQKQQHQELNRNDSSSSGFEMDYETESSRGGGGGDGVAPSYEESDIIRQSSSTKEQQQPYLSMSTSVMTPEFFDHNNANKDASPLRRRHRDRAKHKSNHKNSKRMGSVAGAEAPGILQQSSVAKAGDDDETYDYGSRSDDDQNDTDNQSNNSHYSLSYEQRRLKQARETKVREAAIAKAKQEMEDGGVRGGGFIQREKVEKYRKNIDTPLMRTAAGVAAAATVGCMVLGPVGLLVGAAAVGIGVGYMEIPEEQRKNINSKTAEAVNSAQESILNASEKLSNSCATTYQDSGISDHVPVEIQTCCTELGMGGLGGDNDAGMGAGDEQDGSVIMAAEDKLQNGISREWTGPGDQSRAMMSKAGGILVVSPTNDGMGRFRERSNRGKVACLRKGKVVPVAQIHSLDPAAQPRAWIDVICSADSEVFEKIEAAEEILILAKDKMRARMFVEEGILDAVMWIIDRYLEKTRKGPGWETWAFPDITKDEARLAKLAASCCLTLGKSYCAAIHTEGDLLLMSLYERGTVPEERQLAQMLHEVPHHTRATQTDDPTIVTPGHELFALKQLTLPQAEEVAATIYGLATGQQEV